MNGNLKLKINLYLGNKLLRFILIFKIKANLWNLKIMNYNLIFIQIQKK